VDRIIGSCTRCVAPFPGLYLSYFCPAGMAFLGSVFTLAVGKGSCQKEDADFFAGHGIDGVVLLIVLPVRI
jgi:hypothetical protein